VQAAGTRVFYCGRYEFRGETVVHLLELSLLPNWVGVDQERLVQVTGNRLAFRVPNKTFRAHTVELWTNVAEIDQCCLNRAVPG
jgi:hypothetical protein